MTKPASFGKWLELKVRKGRLQNGALYRSHHYSRCPKALPERHCHINHINPENLSEMATGGQQLLTTWFKVQNGFYRLLKARDDMV